MVLTLDAKRQPHLATIFDAYFHPQEDAFVFRLARKENSLNVLKSCPVSPDDVPRPRSAPASRRKR